jgi:hypothetical protein
MAFGAGADKSTVPSSDARNPTSESPAQAMKKGEKHKATNHPNTD